MTYEKSALNNIDEALNQVFVNSAADSSATYNDLNRASAGILRNWGIKDLLSITRRERHG